MFSSLYGDVHANTATQDRTRWNRIIKEVSRRLQQAFCPRITMMTIVDVDISCSKCILLF